MKSMSAALAALLLITLSSCNKEVSSASGVSNSTASTSQTLALTTSTKGGDSVYAVNVCRDRMRLDTVAQSALLASITSYLSTNYSGYTFLKAVVVKDTAGTVQGYVVGILYNNRPVALQFDASGNFVKVLELREKRDLNDDHGFHNGGVFDNRDGQQRDTVALGALPSAIRSYFAANYASDTLVRAYVNKDTSYLVISRDNGLFATVFSSSGAFVKRIELPAPHGKAADIAQADLPQAIRNYLSATYPNYVFDKAFVIKSAAGVVLGYGVVIDANSTKYGLAFDGSGNFIAVKTIH